MNIITGEKLQQLADIYIGNIEDLEYNPLIRSQRDKHLELNSIISPYNNPYTIFCYTHRIYEFAKIIHFFQNPFCLITHNSDENIIENEDIISILNCPILVKWHSQNICFYHKKLFMLPIGIANRMWPHGNTSIYSDIVPTKTKSVYFHFNIHTNRLKREVCYNVLHTKLEWLPEIPPNENIYRLSQYKYCICPEGNGVDTHRLWEALYVKCIPIVIKSQFSETLIRNNISVIVLDQWADFNENHLIYNEKSMNFIVDI